MMIVYSLHALLIYCFCALIWNISTNGDESINNLTPCVEKAHNFFLAVVTEYSNKNTTIWRQFLNYPFVPETLNNPERYTTLCNDIENVTAAFKRCGNSSHTQLKLLKSIPHMFLCDNKNEILPQVECLMEAADSRCVANCHQTFKVSLDPNCTKFHCYLSCVKGRCKELVLSYYQGLFQSATNGQCKWKLISSTKFRMKANSEQKASNWKECNCTHYPLMDYDGELVPPKPVFDDICIKQCFLPSLSSTKLNDSQHMFETNNNLVCNVAKCAKDIEKIMFTKNTHFGDWFDVTNDENHIGIALSHLGLAQFSFGNRTNFVVNVIIYSLKIQSNFSSSHTQYYDTCTVNRLNYTEDVLQGKAFKMSKLSSKQTYLSFNKTSHMQLKKKIFYFNLDIELANGRIKHNTIFAPDVAKTVFPPEPPNKPSGLPNGIPLIYSKFYIELILTWGCPFRWNARPVGYNVMCKIGPWFTLQKDNIPISNPQQAWYDSYSFADTVLQKRVPWTERVTSFWLRSPLNYHSLMYVDYEEKTTFHTLNPMCRVQAISSMGPGKWIDAKMMPLYGPINIQEEFGTDIYETRHQNNSWSYSVAGSYVSAFVGMSIHSMNRLLISARHNETKMIEIKNPLLSVGCYDWIADRWYMAVNRAADKSVWLAISDETSTGIPKLSYLVRLDAVPYKILCYPTTSMIVWSIVTREEMRIFKYSLNGTVEELKLSDYHCTDCDIPQNDRLATPAISRGYVTSNHKYIHDWLSLMSGKVIPDRTIILQTYFGIWRVWFDTCKCSQIISTKELEQKSGRKAQDVEYIAITSFASLKLVLKSGNQSSNIFMIEYEREFSALLGMEESELRSHYINKTGIIPLQEQQLEMLPFFPSRIVEGPTIAERISVVTEFQHALPKLCFYPNVSIVDKHPRGLHTTLLKIELQWNDSTTCKILSKPKVIYEVKYLPLKEKHIDHVCIGSECACSNNQCRRWSSGLTSERQSYTVTLIDLESDTTFYIEVSVRPDLGNFERLWYGDRVEPRVSTSSFSSHYDPPTNKTMLIIAGVFIALLIFTLGLLYYMYQKKWYIYRQIQKLSADQIEIDKKNNLGSGKFGEVIKARVNYNGRHWCGLFIHTKHSFSRTLAIKMLKKSANDRDKKAFLEEAILLSKLDSDYIVRTMGICMDSRPIMLALEYCDGGSLDVYLKKDEVRQKITISDLYSISLDVLKGCHHLEQKAIAHRDISAKNCLVCQRSNSVRPSIAKITDFGLAKALASKSDRTYSPIDVLEFPIAHTAPEGFGGKFSSKSDVWSYGVVLWEIWSWAADPFAGCAIHSDDDSSCPMESFSSGAEIRNFVCDTQKPQSLADWQIPCGANFTAEDEVQQLMKSCWAFQPNIRPTFTALLQYIKEAKSRILQKEIRRPPIRNNSSQPDRVEVEEGEDQLHANENVVSEATNFTVVDEGNTSNLLKHNPYKDKTREETSLLVHNPYGNPNCHKDNNGDTSMGREETKTTQKEDDTNQQLSVSAGENPLLHEESHGSSLPIGDSCGNDMSNETTSLLRRDECGNLIASVEAIQDDESNDEVHAIANSLLKSDPCENQEDGIDTEGNSTTGAIELKILK